MRLGGGGAELADGRLQCHGARVWADGHGQVALRSGPSDGSREWHICKATLIEFGKLRGRCAGRGVWGQGLRVNLALLKKHLFVNDVSSSDAKNEIDMAGCALFVTDWCGTVDSGCETRVGFLLNVFLVIR